MSELDNTGTAHHDIPPDHKEHRRHDITDFQSSLRHCWEETLTSQLPSLIYANENLYGFGEICQYTST
ncbi:hypothetical protein WG66_002219 [Moniliophthora roreri]|nr:hypothetical protein WG66_002219 [Moniliophthora roreri]